jgi:hypothetical protein
MPKKHLYLFIAVLLLVVLACNMPGATTPQASDPDMQYTQAAQTVQAQLTSLAQTQAAGGAGSGSSSSVTPTSTFTSIPQASTATFTMTPSPVPASPTDTQICDRAEFVTDVTVADGTVFSAGDTFTKTWRIRNTGTCSWTPSYTFRFSNGEAMSGPSSIALSGNVNPGQTVDISVNLKAPSSPDNYTGYWKLRNASGTDFFTVYVKIKVGGGGSGSGGSGSSPFAVIHVYYTTTTWNSPGFVDCPQVNAEIVVNRAGTVEYHWVRSDGPATSGTLTFTAAGSQIVTAKWSLGSMWAGSGTWMGIYIDSPNHQDFGHAAVNACTSP